MDSTDFEIREALHRKLLKPYHRCSSTLIVDELGLAHGKNRIDIAVLNGYLHGYEIKSAKDNLQRLTEQLREYRRSLQKLTIVVAPNHLDKVLSISPEWAGIIEAQKGPRGGISFSCIRKASMNPEVDGAALAHLLWRKEAIELLIKRGIPGKELKKPRKQLYEIIANEISQTELLLWIKEKFIARETWRPDLRPV
ncbi:MAG: sce7726 family protein [Methyloprofundus sp.]|nr:sce7726 family protein [Methyloprofundus sp.]